MEEWYSPKQIVFTKSQIIFLLTNLKDIREGAWPPDPRGSSYTQPEYKRKKKGGKQIKHRISRHPPFERISDVVVGLDRRLETTKYGGVWLEAVYGGWLYPENLAKKFRVSTEVVNAEIKKALQYIISPWPKRYEDTREIIPYSEFDPKLEIQYYHKGGEGLNGYSGTKNKNTIKRPSSQALLQKG